MRPKVSFGDAERKGQYFSKSVALLDGVVFFQERILQKKEKRATSTQRFARKSTFSLALFSRLFSPSSSCFVGTSPRSRRPFVLASTGGRFLWTFPSGNFAPPLCFSFLQTTLTLFQSATKTKRKEKGRKKTLFLSRQSRSFGEARLCFCVCVFARVILGERDDE